MINMNTKGKKTLDVNSFPLSQLQWCQYISEQNIAGTLSSGIQILEKIGSITDTIKTPEDLILLR